MGILDLQDIQNSHYFGSVGILTPGQKRALIVLKNLLNLTKDEDSRIHQTMYKHGLVPKRFSGGLIKTLPK